MAELGRGTSQAGAILVPLLSRLLHGIVRSGIVAAPAGGAIVLAAFREIDRTGSPNNLEGTLGVVVGDFADQKRAAPPNTFGVQVGVALGYAQAGQGFDAFSGVAKSPAKSVRREDPRSAVPVAFPLIQKRS